jgi:cytochrome c
MKLLPMLLAGTALALSTLTPALANQELAQKKACMACHGIDKKIVGPAYLDVAKKYKGQKDAEAKLTQKVLKGGGGVWGTMAMPANTQVNEAEAKQLVKWILSLK